MKTKIITFKYAKSTKNTHKFDEVAAVGEPPIVGTLYIQKWFAPTAGIGTEAQIHLEVKEGGAEKFEHTPMP